MKRRQPRFQPQSSSSLLPKVVKCAVYVMLATGLVSPFAFWYLSSPAQSHTTPPNYRGHFQRKAEQAGGLRLSDATDGGVALVAAAAAGAAAAPGGGKAVGRDPSTPGLSILILCVNELDSLKASLDTWERGGVLQFADEVLLYFQGRNKRKEQFAAPYLKRGTITRLLGDGRLFPIGAAVNWLVGNASYPTVMFLEKDFQLIEPAQFVAPRLNDGLRMLASGEADVVRYRSRWHAGEPNYAEGMFKGREHVILQKQPNLYCSVHYWMPNDMLDQKPHTRYLWRCPTTTEYYCTKAKFCNWTNNPQMFFRSWYMKRFYDKVTAILKKKAPDNDLEFFMNWNYEAWNNADITVAMGEGLFSHVEIGEHAPLNFDIMRQQEKEADKYQDCDIGRRFSQAQCEDHNCLWKPGHPIATCIGLNDRLEDCGATDQQSCEAIPRCFWNPWTVWLPSSCVRDKVPPKSWTGPSR